MERLAGKVAIITGAASGIGRAATELFARQGARVYAVDVNAPDPQYDHPAIHFSIMNVASEDDWRELTDGIVARDGAVDILVNNAGIGGSMLPIAEENLGDWNRVMGVNATGPFLGMRAVLPSMRAKKAGSIINVSSIWGSAAVAGVAAYHASKAAVRHLSKNAAVTYAADNIRVNSIHPGIILTPLVKTVPDDANAITVAATPLGRMGRPIEIANGMLFLASEESSFMTGAELVIDGGYLAK